MYDRELITCTIGKKCVVIQRIIRTYENLGAKFHQMTTHFFGVSTQMQKVQYSSRFLCLARLHKDYSTEVFLLKYLQV